MKILIVDDSKITRLTIKRLVADMGHEVLCIDDGVHVISALENQDFDLILMDILMPELDGISATKLVKSHQKFKDIPIIMVSGQSEESALVEAFEAGAMDYINKPPNLVQLGVRVKSALKLKSEMDTRKRREQSLLEVSNALEVVNQKLERLSTLDGLTGIPNRRHFDDFLSREWGRMHREGKPLSLILGDIDHFKPYNDTYGHQAGDDCIKQVANELEKMAKRGGDLAARYGGEEFVLVLSDTKIEDATAIAEKLRKNIEALTIKHEASESGEHVTISLGVATTIPWGNDGKEMLLEEADKGLYRCKEKGRNKVSASSITTGNGKQEVTEFL